MSLFQSLMFAGIVVALLNDERDGNVLAGMAIALGGILYTCL